MEDTNAHSWVTFGFSFVTIFIAAFSITFVKLSAFSQSQRIRKKLFAAVLRHDMTWFDQNGGQNFIANLNEEVSMIEEGIGNHLAYFIYYFINIVFGIGISCWLSWKLTIVLGALIPVNLLFSFFTLKVKKLILNR